MTEQYADDLAEIVALRSRLEWQPIETAPRDGTAVLLYQPKGEFQDEHRTVGKWYAEFWTAVAIDGWEWEFECNKPTHWMPLPPPPEK